jgi:hypothetical protein
MTEQKQAAPFIDGLYGKLVEGGVGYFFPSAQFDLLEPDLDTGKLASRGLPSGRR